MQRLTSAPFLLLFLLNDALFFFLLDLMDDYIEKDRNRDILKITAVPFFLDFLLVSQGEEWRVEEEELVLVLLKAIVQIFIHTVGVTAVY